MKTSESPFKRIKVGIIANEFFEPNLGGMGGFGWAARHVATYFNEHPEHCIDPIFLNRTLQFEENGPPVSVYDTPFVARTGGRLESIKRLRAERFDLLLMIDYRPSYRFFAAALPRTPIIVWVRDPQAPEDARTISTLRIPGAENEAPQGIRRIDCSSLARILSASRLLNRPVLFAATALHLIEKMPGTYGVRPAEVSFLPNLIEPHVGEIVKSERPRVVFLGRLDPIKRPWLFAKLAERFPQVEFIFMGHPHFEGKGSWRPENLPPNVHHVGHLDGEEKSRWLLSAWALVNMSIHEGLAVSFLEALACETPIISCQNPADVVSRFGYYVGEYEGDGLEALPALAEKLDELLHDKAARERMGKEGRTWVTEVHSPARFFKAFRELCSRLELGDLKKCAP